MGLICPFFQFLGVGHDNFMNESIYDVITDIAPPVRDVLIACWWNIPPRSCSSLFVPLLTEEGLCLALNAINSNEIYTNE